MHETSERLMAILRGERVDRPPLWDPLFAMGRFLGKRYQGDYLAMAEDLGHAAVPIGIVRLALDFLDDHQFGNGEAVLSALSRHARQQAGEADPYWQVQLADARAGAQACRQAGRATFMTIKWCFDAMSNAIGLETLSLACYDQPDLVREAMGWVEQRNGLAVERLIAEARPDFVLFEGNCAYQVGPMIEPGMLAEFCGAGTKQTVARLRDLGIPAVFHTEGKVDAIAPMVIDWGFAGLHGCDPQANDLAELVQTFGDRLMLAGNMDVGLLATASEAEIARATRRMIQVGASGGRFAAGCNTAVQDDCPAENYMAMCQAVAAYELAA